MLDVGLAIFFFFIIIMAWWGRGPKALPWKQAPLLIIPERKSTAFGSAPNFGLSYWYCLVCFITGFSVRLWGGEGGVGIKGWEGSEGLRVNKVLFLVQ